MAEFIGQGHLTSSRISLISKRDIRYVGTLHEISSENSTVALEQVVSFGTEGRRPDDEVPPSDNVYEYIVFRGSDVKDLRIEETPKENKPPQPPKVPDDPAILGSARRSTPSSTPQDIITTPQQQPPSQAQQFQQPQQQNNNQQRQQPPPRFQQQPPFPYYYPPPPNQRFGPQGFPPGPGFPVMPYGAPPPGWYPPPGQGFPHPSPGQFYGPPNPQQMPIGPAGPNQNQQGSQSKQSATLAPAADKTQEPTPQVESPTKPVAMVKLPSAVTTPAPPTNASNGPPPPIESKPNVLEALAPPATVASADFPTTAKFVPIGPKSGRIVPAIPRLSPAAKPSVPVNGNLQSKPMNVAQAPAKPAAPRPTGVVTKSLEEANRDARAAVAAAMAKLPPAPGQKKHVEGDNAVDNLTKKVNEMRTNDNIRTSRQPGTGGYAAGHRGGRGSYRGGRPQSDQQTQKIEVPTTDYDFETANAKFNKQDLVKEAIAGGSPIASPTSEGAVTNGNGTAAENTVNGAPKDIVATNSSAIVYNKTSSFFDNISSEAKEREEAAGKRVGGREFRSEEQKKNFETFGQGSVDNGYRGGFRGRGRGRGGRGSFGSRGGRGGVRGGRPHEGAVAAES